MTHYAQHVYTVTYVTAPRGASYRIAHQDPWVQDELHSDLTYWGHDPRWWIYVDTPDPMDRGISGDETLIPWIPGSGVLSQEALILRMSHPVPFGTLLLGHSPGSSSTMEPGESMVVRQALPDPQGLRVTDPGSPSCG